MRIFRSCFLLFSTLALLIAAQAAGTLVSGPMLGYQARRETVIWLETRDAQQVAVDYWLAGQPATKRTLTEAAPAPTPAGGQIFHFRPGLLELGATYEYTVSIDGVRQEFSFPTTFKTKALW